MPRSFYTVSFLTVRGSSEVSRFFNTLQAARKWAQFLRSLPEISETSIFRGHAGSELLEREAA